MAQSPQTAQLPRQPRRFILSSRHNRDKNAAIATFALAAPWIGIVVLVVVSEKLGSWAIRLAVLPFVAALQNHLQILQHEGAHFQLHRDRRINDWLSDLFCSLPFLGFVGHYRRFHFEHHRWLLDPEKDPEIAFYAEQGYHFEPMRLRALSRMLGLDLCGYHYFQFFFSYYRYLWTETRAGRIAPPTREEWTRASVVVLIFLLAAAKGGGFLLLFYWFLPQPTLLFFLLKLQGYGEHARRGSSIDESTHYLELNWIARFFIYPYNSDLHLEHHLRPALPWYRLRPLHRDLGRDAKLGASKLRSYFAGRRSVWTRVLSGSRC